MKKLLSKLAPALAGICAGLLIGYFGARSLGVFIPAQASLWQSLLIYGIILAAAMLSLFLHILVHEAGHLAMGLLCGYRFVSFRVFNFTIVRDKGKLVRKKFKLVGTVGQCLMSPPEYAGGSFPFVLYNLGGPAMNFVFCGIFFAAFLLASNAASPASAIFMIMAIFGAFMGLFNIIPQKIGGVANDGYNAFVLGRNETARRAFWLQLRVNAMVTQGVRYRDLPEEWFRVPDPGSWNDPISVIASLGRYSYLLDRMELKEAGDLAGKLLHSANNMLGLHKNELRCELLFHELIGGCRKAEVERLHTAELKKYIKATSPYLSRQRLLYAYARLFLDDPAAAGAARRRFEDACSHTPFSGEIPGERDLLALVDDIASGRPLYSK